MKQVKILIQNNGKILIRYQGFKGEECFTEAEKIYKLLAQKGINIEIEKIKKTDEYYASKTETKISQK